MNMIDWRYMSDKSDIWGHMNMIDRRYMSDKSDIWGQMGFGDRQTFLILESLLQKKFCLDTYT